MRSPKISRKTAKYALWAFIFASALLFLLPTVLTIANSFMTSGEISANYGALFGKMTDDKKVFISENVNLKFIPDKVTFDQYKAVLITNSDYLMEFSHTYRTNNGLSAGGGDTHIIRLCKIPGQDKKHHLLRLYHTYDNALSGNSGTEFPCCRQVRDTQHKGSGNTPCGILAFQHFPADKGNEANPHILCGSR